ncbi:MAG TPA: POTRA domain-containing protein [Planctomycetaceae bacterium]|nr:POTRA domain-containing protein [Planctomycetaceae bacterium]
MIAAGTAEAQFGSSPGMGGGPPGGPPGPAGSGVVPKRRFVQLEEQSGEIVHEVRFEGIQTILPQAIQSKVQTQAGQYLSERQIREDVRNLYSTRWFYSVEPRVEETEQGSVVVFQLLERPIVQSVGFTGNEKFTSEYLAKYIGLVKGSPFDVALNKEAAKRIERLYKDKGYYFAKVELASGGDKNDRSVMFRITEGEKVVVRGITFHGNEAISSGVLATKLQTKTQKFWFFGGQYDKSTIADDIAALKAYYFGLGYLDAQVSEKVGFSENGAHVYLDYSIVEGPRYRIRNIAIKGTEIISENTLRREMTTLPGDYFTSRELGEDLRMIQGRYGELGRINAKVEAIPRYLETPGLIDIDLIIDEDEVWRIRRINVHITGSNGRPTSHTRKRVIENRMVSAPGDLANPRMIKKSEQRINREQLFEGGPLAGPRIEFNPVPEEETRFAQSLMRPEGTVRGQNLDFVETSYGTNESTPLVRGQNFERGLEQPGNLLWDSSPQGDPFGPALNSPPYPFVQYREGDLDVYVQEARTGRLMFGAGVNSDSGLVGNIVLDERNFDLFRPPTSWDDIVEGRAWRGAGQTFRLEAVPGDQVSRYTASWTDNYFMDTDVSLGLSGFYYQRFLDNWDEQRSGGRVAFGYQFNPDLSGNIAFRLENVDINNPHGAPPPPPLAAVAGSNFLTTVRGTLAHDTRNSAFLPSEGHILTGSYEQAFGEFNYPRLELDASQYFTVWNRIDGQGRHILSLNGRVGWTGDDTPVFEKFYAGGYSSFRGFDFRGVTPKISNIEVGGFWQALGSVQYQVPVTADEAISLVAFTDFGTVEQEVGFSQFRLSVGGGIRLIIPAMGPVPMAFDFAVPLMQEPFDEEQLFAFYVGINR